MGSKRHILMSDLDATNQEGNGRSQNQINGRIDVMTATLNLALFHKSKG